MCSTFKGVKYLRCMLLEPIAMIVSNTFAGPLSSKAVHSAGTCVHRKTHLN